MAETPGMVIDMKRPIDGRSLTQDSPRPLGTILTYSSIGDNTGSTTYIGGGTLLEVYHQVGDSTDQEVYMDLNIKENRTFIHSGKLIWRDAEFDTACLGIVPRPTSYSDGSNTYFNAAYGLILPAAGDGLVTVLPQDMNLVEMPAGLDYGDAKMAFWNADYDSTTHTFSNISAAPYGNGQYNMFSTEVCLGTFANRILLVGGSDYDFTSKDTFELGHNMRLKFVTRTRGVDATGGGDHNWRAAAVIALYRQKVAVNNLECPD